MFTSLWHWFLTARIEAVLLVVCIIGIAACLPFLDWRDRWWDR